MRSDSSPDDKDLVGSAKDNDPTDGGLGRLARRYGPFVAVAALLAVAVVVFQGGDDQEDETSGAVTTDREELVRSGPMTRERAALVGEGFEYGPNCDPETDRVKMPSVYARPCVEPFDGDNGCREARRAGQSGYGRRPEAAPAGAGVRVGVLQHAMASTPRVGGQPRPAPIRCRGGDDGHTDIER